MIAYEDYEVNGYYNQVYLRAYEDMAASNLIVFDSFVKADSIINNPKYQTIICSISGGSDSDVILDICKKVDIDNKVIYVWFDTGLEYQATKKHLVFLEKKYNIEIHRERAIKSIPISAREYGQPFLNKFVSEQIGRLQKYDFKWEDRPYEELAKEYPKCKSAISWWCNHRDTKDYGYSMFNISYNKWLKEFILLNPPTFKIEKKCCTYAKKNVSKELVKRYNADLVIIGIRKGEGGIRAKAYNNCFSNNSDKADSYRPIFWYSGQDKVDYEGIYNVTHSECYTTYGMTRTGCAGCPFNRKLSDDMEVIQTYEPKLGKAVNKIFKDSYEYTRQYRKFYDEMQAKEKDINLC